jgi:hypothetical protein
MACPSAYFNFLQTIHSSNASTIQSVAMEDGQFILRVRCNTRTRQSYQKIPKHWCGTHTTV